MERLGFNVFDVAYRRGHHAFCGRHNAVAHLFRRQATILPYNRNYRYVDIGKDIRWHLLDAEDAKDENQKRKDDKGIGPPERKPDNPHKVLLAPEPGL